jgi:putative transposase
MGRCLGMPRRARIIVPGIPVHIVQRGNNRAQCFFSPQDRSFYLHHLGRLLGESSCALHAYCLMTNHVHLLMTPERPDSCSRLMRRLDLLHSQYINRLYKRTGSLWEGRFRSCVVESEAYALRCYRYVEMNPVRAGIVQHPGHYDWSSYRANAEGAQDALVTPHDEYLRLGRGQRERQDAYRDFLGSCGDNPQAIREATNGNSVLGSRSFMRSLSTALGRRVERGIAGRPVKNVVRP